MASANEIFESRDGYTTGATGTTSAPRRFSVIVDEQGDDPVKTLLDEGAIAEGQLYPWGTSGVVSLTFSVRRRGATEYMVTVQHGVPTFAPDTRWEIGVRTFLKTKKETEAVVGFVDDNEDRPIKDPIGPHLYATEEELAGTLPNPNVITGFSAIVVRNGFVGKKNLLRFRDKPNRRVEGIDVLRPVTEYTYRTRVTTLEPRLQTRLERLPGKVNGLNFRGWDRDQVLCTGSNTQQVYGVSTDIQPIIGAPVYDVSFTFQADVDGFQPVKVQDTFATEGLESAILVNQPETEEQAQVFTEYYPYTSREDFDEVIAAVLPTPRGFGFPRPKKGRGGR